ncbi:MAG: hypothetical protein HYS20_01190 [Rhodocyclales bacterium]|nr:hypothetical protein [Rhodocyclales bacterium]
MAAHFADKPTAGIPCTCGDWAEMQAVYRFLDQSKDDKRGLDWQAIPAPNADGANFDPRDARVGRVGWESPWYLF